MDTTETVSFEMVEQHLFGGSGARVKVNVDGQLLLGEAWVGSRWPVALRNALHQALTPVYPVTKVRVPRCANNYEANERAWIAVLEDYERQVKAISAKRQTKG